MRDLLVGALALALCLGTAFGDGGGGKKGGGFINLPGAGGSANNNGGGNFGSGGSFRLIVTRPDFHDGLTMRLAPEMSNAMGIMWTGNGSNAVMIAAQGRLIHLDGASLEAAKKAHAGVIHLTLTSGKAILEIIIEFASQGTGITVKVR